MKISMKKISMPAALIVCCLTLSGCLSHWFTDSTTRLQVENRSSQTIVEIDIISEDGSEYKFSDGDRVPIIGGGFIETSKDVDWNAIDIDVNAIVK